VRRSLLSVFCFLKRINIEQVVFRFCLVFMSGRGRALDYHITNSIFCLACCWYGTWMWVSLPIIFLFYLSRSTMNSILLIICVLPCNSDGWATLVAGMWYDSWRVNVLDWSPCVKLCGRLVPLTLRFTAGYKSGRGAAWRSRFWYATVEGFELCMYFSHYM